MLLLYELNKYHMPSTAPYGGNRRPEYQPDPRFARIGYAIDNSERERCQLELQGFAPRFFGGLAGDLKERAAFRIRKLVKPKELLEKTQKELEIVNKYWPDLEAALRSFKVSFMEWERLNKIDGYAPETLISSEKEAENLISELEQAAQKELDEADSELIIIGFNRLIVSRTGWISIDNAIKYWRGMTSLLEERIKALSPDA